MHIFNSYLRYNRIEIIRDCTLHTNCRVRHFPARAAPGARTRPDTASLPVSENSCSCSQRQAWAAYQSDAALWAYTMYCVDESVPPATPTGPEQCQFMQAAAGGATCRPAAQLRLAMAIPGAIEALQILALNQQCRRQCRNTWSVLHTRRHGSHDWARRDC